MRVISTEELERTLTFPVLVDRLREAFRAANISAPVRQQHGIPNREAPDGTLLIMPAWQEGGHIGVKTVTVYPGNPAHARPAVMGTYILLDARSGAPIAVMDGRLLTLRRTAAASALAASYLARRQAQRLLVVGTGALADR
ncbi:MAG: ornithine cyclodeaminase family protein, partial [Myxococcota bacterium]